MLFRVIASEQFGSSSLLHILEDLKDFSPPMKTKLVLTDGRGTGTLERAQGFQKKQKGLLHNKAHLHLGT